MLPILKVFDRMTNLISPGALPRWTGLAEPLESWAINAIFKLGVLDPSRRKEELWYHLEIYKILNKFHFIPRLSQTRATELINRVLENARAANDDPHSEFIFDMIGLFGSVLRKGTTPRDVDIVYVARFRDTGEVIPESDYYPFSRDTPDIRAGIVLRRGARRTDISCHDLREVKNIGTAYRVIWTRDEGRVDRRTVKSTKEAPDPEKEGADGILQTDAKCNAFRKTCRDSSPLPPPERPKLPRRTKAMTFNVWASALTESKLVTLLAHHACLPPGALKSYAEDLIAELRRIDPKKMAEAEQQLFPFLAASYQFGTWKWDPAVGLIEGKSYKRSAFFNPTSAAQVPQI